MKQKRPKFNVMHQQFSRVNVSVPQLGQIIGGKVQQNIDIAQTSPQHGFENGCAIRLSYALHHSGVVIGPGGARWGSSSGADKRLYIYRVRDIENFLEMTFGPADKIIKNPTPEALRGLRGIIIFKRQFSNATGHATLWDGVQCSDRCYFIGATGASIWLLK